MMKITDFGATVNGDETKLYTLTNCNNMEISVTDYGAVLTQVIVPDKEGNLCDVVLGYDEAAEYEAGGLFLGQPWEEVRTGSAELLLRLMGRSMNL